jgi:hypothetical protein
MGDQEEQETKDMTKTLVSAVDFAVPDHATIGPRFPSWGEAVAHARGTIQRFEYRGQRVRPDSPDYHPRRCFQEGSTLVVYSRAFVHMRVTEPVQDRPGSSQQSGQDGVAATWEVFLDGTTEVLPDHSSEQPPAAEPGIWAPSRAVVVAAAQQERHDVMAAATARHLSNVQDELRRYAEDLAHYESVYQLRIAGPEPAETGAHHG